MPTGRRGRRPRAPRSRGASHPAAPCIPIGHARATTKHPGRTSVHSGWDPPIPIRTADTERVPGQVSERLGGCQLTDTHLGTLRWLVVAGPDAGAVFRVLGTKMRQEIRDVVGTRPLVGHLSDHVASGHNRERLNVVRSASKAFFPQEWAELEALAVGAGTPAETLQLLNCRGDLGVVPGGCSDLCWRGERTVLAHNEDGAREFLGRCVLLTLVIEGVPTVTTFWYPGMLPSTAFTVSAAGLVWSLDNLPLAMPAAGAGRHFVARGLQRSARTLDGAVAHLSSHTSAGGFAYNIAERNSGRIVSVEAAAGAWALREAGEAQPVLWHTNHGRHIAGADAPVESSSHRRGAVLAAFTEREAAPTVATLVEILVGAGPPAGVRAESPTSTSAVTLATFVADVTSGTAIMKMPGAGPVAIPLDDLACGVPDHQYPWLPE
jgi:hypothetical protein